MSEARSARASAVASVFLAALAAKHLKRPVRVVLTRSQMFSVTSRPHALQRLSRSDEAGHLQAIRHDAIAATSTYEDQQEALVNWSGLVYKCANVASPTACSELSTPTPGDMRAPGAATGIFASNAPWTSWRSLRYRSGANCASPTG